jgi:hypothetical protein
MLITALVLKSVSHGLTVLLSWIRFMHGHDTREDAAVGSTSGKELLTKTYCL